jgi:hypothetical protein
VGNAVNLADPFQAERLASSATSTITARRRPDWPYALIHQDQSRPVSCCFEVDDMDNAEQVVAKLGIDAATTLSGRRADDEPIADMEDCLSELINAHASLVLTGKVGTVQRLRQGLRRHAVPATHFVAKAYWAPGKTGLD